MRSSPLFLDLSHVFSSRARFRVLEVLCGLERGLALRQIERSSGLAVRSVQVALEGLLQERVLRKDAQGFFRLNPAHPATRLITGVFVFLNQEQRQREANQLSTRARESLQLGDEVRSLLLAQRGRA